MMAQQSRKHSPRTQRRRNDVVRRAAFVRTGDRGTSQVADDPEAVLQGRDPHAALRPAQMVRLLFPRIGRG